MVEYIKGNPIIGYKVVHDDSYSEYGHVHYKVGETYEMDEDPEYAAQGYHFSYSISGAIIQAPFALKADSDGKPNFKLLVVEASGKKSISQYSDCIATNHLEVIKAIDDIDLIYILLSMYYKVYSEFDVNDWGHMIERAYLYLTEVSLSTDYFPKSNPLEKASNIFYWFTVIFGIIAIFGGIAVGNSSCLVIGLIGTIVSSLTYCILDFKAKKKQKEGCTERFRTFKEE